MASTKLNIVVSNHESDEDSGPEVATSPLKSPRKHISVEHIPFEVELNQLTSHSEDFSPLEPSSSSSSSPSSPRSSTSLSSSSHSSVHVSPPVAALEDALHETIRAYFTTEQYSLPDAGALAPAVDVSSLSHPPVTMREASWQNSKFAAMDPHMKAFLSIRVLNAMNCRRPVFLESAMTSHEALRLLSLHNFLSAPLRDPQGRILGFVDVLGLLGLLLVNQTFGDSPLLLPTETLGELIERSWLPLDPPPLVRSDDSLYRAIQIMSEGSHRLLVTDPLDNTVVGIITQSDIVAILNTYPILLGFRATETIAHSKALNAAPESVLDSSSVLRAIGHIAKSGHSALAVVDARGHLVGNFSANSVKGLTDGGISILDESISTFFQTNPALHSFSTLKPSSTLFQAIHMLADTRAHRIWIADTAPEGLHLNGLLTITDIFKSLVQPSSTI